PNNSVITANEVQRVQVLDNFTTRTVNPIGVAFKGSITGRVFDDVNGDGVRQSSEGKAQSITSVFIDTNRDGTRQSGEPLATLGLDGSYRFDGLRPGTYRVMPVLNGALPTNPSSGFRETTVGSGQIVTGQNFGTAQPISINGIVFE